MPEPYGKGGADSKGNRGAISPLGMARIRTTNGKTGMGISAAIRLFAYLPNCPKPDLINHLIRVLQCPSVVLFFRFEWVLSLFLRNTVSFAGMELIEDFRGLGEA
jgi:hypothetical protein